MGNVINITTREIERTPLERQVIIENLYREIMNKMESVYSLGEFNIFLHFNAGYGAHRELSDNLKRTAVLLIKQGYTVWIGADKGRFFYSYLKISV